MEELRFDDRVAVVTGAGRGVGREYAKLLASRGAAVVVNDLGANPDGSGSSPGPGDEVVAEIRAAGGEAVADGHSIAERDGAHAVIEHALAQYGRVDVLIHNAGIVNGTYEQLVAVNLSGAHWLTEAVWPAMHARSYGRVLLTTSSAGIFGTASGPDYTPIESYGATKMGALGLGRSLAVRGRVSGIKVNMLTPHAYTRLSAGLGDSPGLRWMRANSLPERVAPAAVFLVHETCPASGGVFAAGAGRVARIFFGETEGFVDQDLTIEKVAEAFDQICDEKGYHVPEDMSGILDLYMKTVGGNAS